VVVSSVSTSYVVERSDPFLETDNRDHPFLINKWL
jgi:hypothetical protein